MVTLNHISIIASYYALAPLLENAITKVSVIPSNPLAQKCIVDKAIPK
jgi:hypothetical protein